MTEPPPLLRLPLKLTLHDECVAIRDAADISVCYIYYDDECEVRRSVRRRLRKAAAIAVAKVVARALTDAAGRRVTGRESDDGRMARPTDG